MSILVEDPERGVTMEAIVAGEGPDVVLIASAMRGAGDFSMLQDDLSKAGFRSIAIHMRGAGRSHGPESDFTLHDIAEDVAGVIEELCEGPVHIVGHALGNIVARGTASFHPELIRSVMVMPCGGHDLGKYPVTDDVIQAMGRCHDETLGEDERRAALSTAFFAPGNDPGCWLEDWWPAASIVSTSALKTDPEEWWRAGNKPIMILQPLEDAMSPRQSGLNSVEALGEQASYAEIPHCGHAILPEQPELVASAVIAFLQEREAAARG
ncbi:MAG: alpha/beta hydrolase [Novosphingobium sp.]|nr:alpha/beta hydrolase [Novosphingobium sp.]